MSDPEIIREALRLTLGNLSAFAPDDFLRSPSYRAVQDKVEEAVVAIDCLTGALERISVGGFGGASFIAREALESADSSEGAA